MTRLTDVELDAALDATWPPARRWGEGAFTLREGQGGGKRVAAATLDGDLDEAGIDRAAEAMKERQGPVLFRVRSSQKDLDSALAARDYQTVDPTIYFTARPAALLRPDQRPLDAIASEMLLGIQADIWARGGIGPARLQVMRRVQGPRAFLLARLDDRAAGVGFVALHKDIAMVHALEVRPAARRRGAARALLHRAAKWGSEAGANWVALAVTERNTAANTLYKALGMDAAGRYHYREQQTGQDP